ncbi:SurA N-terminal domain-containing protein [Halanaerobium praevalens]|uniref:peptidylprolyl isomerase n=1 Tax=Halanaerobium praevalens (strain ATCC 33744 / DSM 2228 / GSL) TaxID=572479 RepID=E3DRQ4_HALPG|nr:SurA N-terminal domain-containing protein [Halanaerobium praevalens]ADO78118.1 SurA domain protein [Halanaerobium praevalens DSM 2228]
MKKFLVSFLLLTVLMVPMNVFAQDVDSDSKQEPKVVAVVNGEEITAQELAQNAKLNQILRQLSQVDQQLVKLLTNSEAGNKVLADLRKAKLDSLIDNTLLKQAVKDSDINLSQEEIDEIYNKQKSSILKQNKMDEKQFLSVLKKQGFENEAAYKNEFANNPQIKINKLIEKEVVDNIEVSEKEIKEAYEQNKDAFAQTGQDVSYEQIKPRLEQMLKQQKQNQAIKEYLEKLRDNAEVEIKI